VSLGLDIDAAARDGLGAVMRLSSDLRTGCARLRIGVTRTGESVDGCRAFGPNLNPRVPESTRMKLVRMTILRLTAAVFIGPRGAVG
jgi:hypothetical protein